MNRVLVTALFASFTITAAQAGVSELPSQCGKTRAMDCTSKDDCSKQFPVMEVSDAWHGLAQCFRALRDVWARRGPSEMLRKGDVELGPVHAVVERQVNWEMARPRVRWSSDAKTGEEHVVLLNDRKHAYNAMGQSGLAYFLYQFAFLSRNSALSDRGRLVQRYQRFGASAVNGMLLSVSDGGLSTWSNCAVSSVRECVWFHSITRRDLETRAGATLNQHLHAIRDLGLISDLLRANGSSDQGKHLDRAIEAGLAQLIADRQRRTSPPNLASFLSPATGDRRARWAYYGFNAAANDEGGYFLNGNGRDCAYHFHVVELIAQIVERARISGNGAQLIPHLLKCGSPTDELMQAVRLRLTEKEPKRWSNVGSAKGRDFSCSKELLASAGQHKALSSLSCEK